MVTYGPSAWYEPLWLMSWELLWWMVLLMMMFEMSMSLMSGWSKQEEGVGVEGNILAGRTSQSRACSYARALSSTQKATLS